MSQLLEWAQESVVETTRVTSMIDIMQSDDLLDLFRPCKNSFPGV